MNTDRLSHVLSRLLPGDSSGWPAGGTLGIEPLLLEDAARTPEGAAAVAAVLAALPTVFEQLPDLDKDAALKAREAADPDAFSRLVASAYNAYYTCPAVLTVLEKLTGYAARPPQPLGYDLPPFDEALLAKQKQRAPFWRRT